MSRSILQIVARMLVVGVFALALPAALRADSAIVQFCPANNPCGNWSYGATTSLGATFIPYTDTTPVHFNQPGWRGSSNGNPLGWVAANTTGMTLVAGGGQPVWPAGYLFLIPGDLSALSVLRWTAPTSGQYTITGLFQAIDQIQFSTADVYILVNGVPVLSSNALINTFGVQLPFNLTLGLSAGTTIDFAVGNGGNGASHDQIGLVANVNPVPEPGTLVLLGTGIAGIFGFRRRKSLRRIVVLRVFLFVLLVAACAGAARADTIYTYIGNPFTTFSGILACPPVCNITGSFTVAQPLASNLFIPSFTPASFSFTDGLHTLTHTNSTIFVSFSRFVTDSTGTVIEWRINLFAPTGTGGSVQIFSCGGATGCAVQGFTGRDGAGLFTTSTTDGLATNDNQPGTWSSVTSAPVPEPGTMLLMATGMAGLFARRRQAK